MTNAGFRMLHCVVLYSVHAVEASVARFSAFVDERQPLPMLRPSRGAAGVVLPVRVAAKALLWNVTIDDGLGKADLAPKLNVFPNVRDRIHKLNLASRIEQNEAALALLGKRLAVGVRQIA
jgi:antitoxin HicB